MSGTPDPFESWKLFAAAFCRTSKMSHAHGRRGSCGLRLLSPRFHSIRLTFAGGMTDVGVGSGALLGVWMFPTDPMRGLIPRIMRLAANKLILVFQSSHDDWHDNTHRESS